MIPVEHILLLSAVLFTIGVLGVMLRSNVIVIFMSIELMLNAVNLSFVTFSRGMDSMTGVIFIFFIIVVAAGTGFWGTMQRDARFTLVSNFMFILAILRFAASKVSLASDPFDLQDRPALLNILVVSYAVLLVMYFELANGVIRYSMLDTSIRTNEVYVMNPKKIVGKYHRSLIINPISAAILAIIVLSANTILPFIVGIFSSDTATRMEESVELISVYGVALGTFFVFCVVGGLFALNLPNHLQKFREKRAE